MKTKLIVAFDFANQKEALSLASQLDPEHCALKIGSEMFTLFGAPLVRELINMGFKIFLDLKFHDIPNTVAQACRACAELGVWMINVHASGGLTMMQAARKALEPFDAQRPLLIAVTVLTSMGDDDLPAMGLNSSVDAQVSRLAQLAYSAGLDGVVCSPHEVPKIKELCGQYFLTVTPGIRLLGDSKNDQRRVMTAEEALALGSDFLVVGRSITAAQSPALIVQEILGLC